MERTIFVKAAHRGRRYNLQFYTAESISFAIENRPTNAATVLTLGPDMQSDPAIEISGSDHLTLDPAVLSVIPEGGQWHYNIWLQQEGELVLVRYGSLSKLQSLAPTHSQPNTEAEVPLASASDPVLSGIAQVGQTLTVSQGDWTGSEQRSFSYQWRRNGTEISGATNAAYVVISADDQTALSCTVRASDGYTQVAATAQALSITYPAPTNTAAPQISGSFILGQTLNITDGIWSAPATFSRQWTRDDVSISGATGPTYSSQPADVGHTIGCRVIAINSGGAGSIPASGTAEVTEPAPSNALLLIVAGQSNSRTAGTSSATPPARYKDGSLGDVSVFIRGSGANVLAEIADGGFQTYDVRSNADPDNSGTAWGSEAEFIYQLRQDGDTRPVYVVKESQNGQSLAQNWNPDVSNDNFAHLEAKIARTRTTLNDITFEEVTLWNQGEADANVLETSNAYAANWTNFLSEFRTRISTGLFIAERIRPLGYEGASVTDNSLGFLQAWTVREALLAGVLADANALAVDTDFDAGNFNNIHPTEPWIENKGLRCYAAYTGTYDATYGSIHDTAPSTVSFSDVNDAAPSSSISSEAVLIGGIERRASVSVMGGEFRALNSLDNDYVVSDWATSGFVDKFQRLQLRTTSSETASTATDVTVIIGGQSNNWTVTTYASAPSYEPETNAFITQVGTNEGLAIAGADAAALDAFYVAAKTSPWFAKLTRLYLRLGDQVASSLDLVDQATSLGLESPSGMPYTWDATAGWSPVENSNTGINLKVDPSIQLPQDASSVGVFYSSLATNTRGDFNGGDGIFMRNTDAGAARYLLNSNSNTNASGLPTTIGLRAIVRDGASSLRLHGSAGTVVATGNTPSIGPTGNALCLGNTALTGSNLIGGIHSDATFFGAFAAGAALSEVEMQNLVTIVENLLAHFAP